MLARVLEAAEKTGSVTAIAHATRLSTAEARAALARLEADGQLVRHGLGGWLRALRTGASEP
jgi:DNA-binding IclR family transcriptional regulator